jgi:hypothetical protein
LLIAEEWAVPAAPLPKARFRRVRTSVTLNPADATTRPQVPLSRQLGDIRRQIERRSFQPHDHRRAEDRIRDAWHDEHAKTINPLHAALARPPRSRR